MFIYVCVLCGCVCLCVCVCVYVCVYAGGTENSSQTGKGRLGAVLAPQWQDEFFCQVLVSLMTARDIENSSWTHTLMLNHTYIHSKYKYESPLECCQPLASSNRKVSWKSRNLFCMFICCCCCLFLCLTFCLCSWVGIPSSVNSLVQ